MNPEYQSQEYPQYQQFSDSTNQPSFNSNAYADTTQIPQEGSSTNPTYPVSYHSNYPEVTPPPYTLQSPTYPLLYATNEPTMGPYNYTRETYMPMLVNQDSSAYQDYLQVTHAAPHQQLDASYSESTQFQVNLLPQKCPYCPKLIHTEEDKVDHYDDFREFGRC